MEKISKEKEKSGNNFPKIVILYDEYQFSFDKANEKIINIFKEIEKHNNDKNNKKKLYHKEKESIISLNNKYYSCDIIYDIQSINNLEKINISDYEGIILFFEETSIKNNIFTEKSHHFKDENNFSSCIIIFEEDREDLQNIDSFDKFIGETIDKHFEVICNCENFKDYNEDDGIGALNLSLHSTQWRGGKNIESKKEEKNEKNIKEIKIEKDDENKYSELKDSDEIEKIFGKIKEIKQINSNPNISMEERRNNAEKAVLMLMNMFKLDEGEEENEETEKEQLDKIKNILENKEDKKE